MADEPEGTISPVKVVGSETVPEWEQSRRLDKSQSLHRIYDFNGIDYTRRDEPGSVVFSDRDIRITTDAHTVGGIYSMVMLAESKGWEEVEITGTDAFVAQARQRFDSAAKALNDERARHSAASATVSEKPVENTVERGVRQAAEMTETESSSKPERLMGILEKQQANREAAAEEARQLAAGRRQKGKKPIVDEAVRKRREELGMQVYAQFRVSGSKFYFKDVANSVNMLAFQADGNKMTSARNSEKVTTAIVVLAESKGWESIRVSGHKEFKRQVWAEATRRGIEVKGYAPDRHDRAKLAQSQEARQGNVVEKTTVSKGLDKQATAEDTRLSKGREQAGTLLDHGAAPYRHDKSNSASYYVSIETATGEKTVWGKELAGAIGASGARTGDKVIVTNTGKKPVTVEVEQKNEQGKVIGQRTVSTHRNSWDVSVTERKAVMEAVASAAIDAGTTDPAGRQRLKDGIAARLATATEVPVILTYDRAGRTAPQPARSRTQTKEQELSR